MIGDASTNPNKITTLNNTLDDGSGNIKIGGNIDNTPNGVISTKSIVSGAVITGHFNLQPSAGAGLVLTSNAIGTGTWAALLSNALTVTSADSSITVSQVLTNIDLSLNLVASHVWVGIQHLPSLSDIHSANSSIQFTEVEALGAVNGTITNDSASYGNTNSILQIKSDQSATNYLQLGDATLHNLNVVETALNVIDDGLGNNVTSGFHSFAGLKTTTPGDSGNAYWYMPEQGSAYKKVAIYLDAFVSATGTDLTFPTAFTDAPFIYGTAAAIALCTVIASKVTVTNSGGGVTGWIFLEGF
jgi:hypothetical protein